MNRFSAKIPPEETEKNEGYCVKAISLFLFPKIFLGNIGKGKGKVWQKTIISTMSLKNICDLPVDSISHKDSVLFFMDNLPYVTGSVKRHNSMGIYVQNVCFCLGETK